MVRCEATNHTKDPSWLRFAEHLGMTEMRFMEDFEEMEPDKEGGGHQ
jgi:hypothetical protein